MDFRRDCSQLASLPYTAPVIVGICSAIREVNQHGGVTGREGARNVRRMSPWRRMRLPAMVPGQKPHPPPWAHSDRKSTRLNSSHMSISYAVFCLKKKKKNNKYYTI